VLLSAGTNDPVIQAYIVAAHGAVGPLALSPARPAMNIINVQLALEPDATKLAIHEATTSRAFTIVVCGYRSIDYSSFLRQHL
jgi:hypothetical protein